MGGGPGCGAAGATRDIFTPDAIEASTELDVAALIEDEVLLSLPLAPRHAEGACTGRVATQVKDDVRKHSAFAELGALKRPHNKH